MRRVCLLLSAFAVACSVGSQNAHARRGIPVPIPVFWGSGEKMTEMGDLPREVSRSANEELGMPVTVGFLHERAHLFWLDLWTWNGRHVLYSGENYWELDPIAWREMIGSDPSSKYGKPVFYRVPSLMALLGVVGAGYWSRRRFFKTEQEKLEALFKDKRYQRSLETLFSNSEGENQGLAITEIDEQRFLRAKRELTGVGIDADMAEANLRKVADVVIESTNAEIDGAIKVASEMDQQGESAKSAEIYDQLIALLPNDDDRHAYVTNCLASVNAKRESSDPALVQRND